MKGKRVAVAAGAVAIVVLALASFLGWRHFLLLYRFEAIGPNQFGYPEYRHRQTGIVMVRLPGGRFWMGAQRADPNGQNYDPDAEDDEGPVHEVTLSPFLIGKYEVTQGQWKAVMGSNPSHFKGDDDRPVENISWEDIQEFEKRTGLSLPTEARWEYACRGGTTVPIAGTGNLEEMGWYKDNSESTTHPVGQKEPNGFGLHDMHGNVWEWCEDVYDPDFFGNSEAREPDPVSVTGSGDRVFRGGNWGYGAWRCRASDSLRFPPGLRSDYLGFRLASPVP